MRRRELIVDVGLAAILWPCTVRAQQKALPLIGFLSSRSPEDSSAQMAGFRQGLAEMSYVEGENLAIEYRWARGDYRRLPALATNLVGKPVRVIAAVGGDPSALAAKAATSTIPIVFSMGDPVQAGLVESYNRPGGNHGHRYRDGHACQAEGSGARFEKGARSFDPGGALKTGATLVRQWR
jgi:putative ABC transport system substrate-binding protein